MENYIDFFALIAIVVVIYLIVHFSKKRKLDRQIKKIADVINKYERIRAGGDIWVTFFEALLKRHPLQSRYTMADNIAEKIAEIIEKETGEHCIDFFALGINGDAPEIFLPLFRHSLYQDFRSIFGPILSDNGSGEQAIDWMYKKYLEKEGIKN